MNKKTTQKLSASKNIFINRAEEKSTSSYFNHLGNGYQIFRHEKLILALKKCLYKNKHTNLLDIGCANGHFTYKVFKYFSFENATGIDFVPNLIKEAKSLYKHLNFSLATLPYLKFKKDQFELVILSEVLYYLKPCAQLVAIKKIKKITKKNGYILISSPNKKNYLTFNQIKNLIKNNFEIILVEKLRMKYYHIFISPFFFVSRIAQLLKSNKKPLSKKNRTIFNKIYPIVSKFPIRQIIFLFNIFSKKFIENKILPKILDFTCYFSKPTNIIIIARVIK